MSNHENTRPGPKPLYDSGRMKKYFVRLPDHLLRKAQAMGAAAIRELIEQAPNPAPNGSTPDPTQRDLFENGDA